VSECIKLPIYPTWVCIALPIYPIWVYIYGYTSIIKMGHIYNTNSTYMRSGPARSCCRSESESSRDLCMCVCVCVRKRERERERQTERDREREREGICIEEFFEVTV
jgi:hypothetical protein